MEPMKTKPPDELYPQIVEGDLLLGLGCCGVYTDDFPQCCGALETDKTVLDTRIPELGCTIGEALKKPVRSYEGLLARLNRRGFYPKTAVPITGSLRRSIPAGMPAGLTARIETASFPIPTHFDFIARRCGLSQMEMFDSFNMGLGMVIVISRYEVGQMKNTLCCCGERAYIIGSVVRGSAGIELV